MLTLFLGSFFFSWFFFGIMCFIVAYYHGDFLFDAITGERLGHGQDPCIYGVTNFVSMLLYSITTQTTIGGSQYASEECPETIFLYIMQMMCGAAIEGSMVSVVYAKILRPPRLWTKLKFSDKAVVRTKPGSRRSINYPKFICGVFFILDLLSRCETLFALSCLRSPRAAIHRL